MERSNSYCALTSTSHKPGWHHRTASCIHRTSRISIPLTSVPGQCTSIPNWCQLSSANNCDKLIQHIDKELQHLSDYREPTKNNSLKCDKTSIPCRHPFIHSQLQNKNITRYLPISVSNIRTHPPSITEIKHGQTQHAITSISTNRVDLLSN